MKYMIGYNGGTKTLAQLQAWSQWNHLDPEYRRRALWLMETSMHEGSPIGLGGIWRSTETQLLGALTRHIEVASGGCCTYNGKHYAKKANVAHMIFPPWSYHLDTTPSVPMYCEAIDFTGNLKWLTANAARAGLRTFANVNNEPWHAQPIEIPNGKRQYVPSKHYPLPVFPLPGMPSTPPSSIVVDAPLPTLRANSPKNSVQEAREFQLACNYWGWRDANGMQLVVDGNYGYKTASACRNMQVALRIYADSVYGPQSYKALTEFLTYMTTKAA